MHKELFQSKIQSKNPNGQNQAAKKPTEKFVNTETCETLKACINAKNSLGFLDRLHFVVMLIFILPIKDIVPALRLLLQLTLDTLYLEQVLELSFYF